MPSRRHLRLGLSTLLLAALLAGCKGGSETEVLQRAATGLQSADPKLRGEAVVQLKSLLQKKPGNAQARLLLASHLLATGDPNGAKADFQRALEAGATPAEVLPKLARAMLVTGQGALVVSQYGKESLGNAEADAQLKSVIASAQMQQGHLDDAARTIEAALRAAPGHPAASQVQAQLAAARGDPAKAIEITEAVLAKHPRNADALALRAELWLGQPDGRARATEVYQQAVEADPRHVIALANLVSLRLVAGDLDGARLAQKQLRLAGPQLVVTEQQEGTLAYAAGDHARAREVFQALLRGLPDHINLLLLSGQNELKLNSAIQAETMFSRALALQPGNDTARRLLAQAQLALGQVPRALNTLAPLVDKPDAGPDLLALAAEASLLNGDNTTAQALYARAAKLKPVDPKLRTVLATAALGRQSDDWVVNELRGIAASDAAGTSAELALVSTHLRRGQPAEALKALDAVDAKRPKDPNPRILRGQILVGQGDLAGARRAFEAALANSPGHLKAALALSALDLREDKLGDARKRLQDLLKQQPRNTRLMLALAELQARPPADQAARKKLLEEAVRADRNDGDAHAALVAYHAENGNLEAASVAAQAAVTAMPQSLDMLDLQARTLLQRGEAQQAMSSYAKMTSLAPRDPRGHLGTIDLNLRDNDLADARRAVDRGLQAIPGSTDLLVRAFMLAVRSNKPADALAIARSLQTDRPGLALGWTLEAELEASRQKWDAAAAGYRKALDKASPDGVLLKYLHVLQAGGHADEARSFAAAWLKKHPDDLLLRFYLGDLAQRGGDLKLARQHYEDVLKRNGDHVPALNNLALLTLAQQQPGALALARRAAAAAPRQPDVLDTLAQAQAAEGSLGDAIATQRQAVALAPAAADLRLALAKLLVRNGDRSEARQQLGKLADLGKNYRGQAEVDSLLRDLGPLLR